MSKITITVTNTDQLHRLVEHYKHTDIDLTVELKENTTTENSDVNQTSYGKKYHEASHLLTQIKNFLELNY